MTFLCYLNKSLYYSNELYTLNEIHLRYKLVLMNFLRGHKRYIKYSTSHGMWRLLNYFTHFEEVFLSLGGTKIDIAVSLK